MLAMSQQRRCRPYGGLAPFNVQGEAHTMRLIPPTLTAIPPNGYIVPFFDVLHTQGKQYVTDDLVRLMRHEGVIP